MNYKPIIMLLLLLTVPLLYGCKIEQPINTDVIAFAGAIGDTIPDPLPPGDEFTVLCGKQILDVSLTRAFKIPRTILEPYAGADSIPVTLIIDTDNRVVLYMLDGYLVYGSTWGAIAFGRLIEVIKYLK